MRSHHVKTALFFAALAQDVVAIFSDEDMAVCGVDGFCEGRPESLSLIQKNMRISRVEADFDVAAITTTTTIPAFNKNSTASEEAGVAANKAGDLAAFLSALITNLVAIAICLSIFMWWRVRFPLVYSGNVLNDEVTTPIEPMEPEEKEKWLSSYTSWYHASMGIKGDDVVHCCGLDHWMLLELCNLAMKVMAALAVPNLLVLAPMHMFLGGGRAGDDNLSKLGMANVVDGSWLYWCHSIVVWLSVIIVTKLIFDAQQVFIQRRFQWLKEMPAPRSRTVLVESIEPEWASDKLLRQYFEDMFTGSKEPSEELSVVESAIVIKNTKELLGHQAEVDAFEELLAGVKEQYKKSEYKDRPTIPRPRQLENLSNLKDLNAQILSGNEVDAIDHYETLIKEVQDVMAVERKKFKDLSEDGRLDPSYFNIGFVTFRHRRDAEISLKLCYTPDEDAFKCSIPPDPSDVIYTDLQVDETRESISEFGGWLCVAGLFFGYMPIIVGISSVASLDTLQAHVPLFRTIIEEHPSIAGLWNGLVGALALTFMMSFLPTFLSVIFYRWFALRAEAWLQHKVQIWYYYFNVVFVLLVTAVGSSLFATIDQLVEDPFSVFKLLAESMPTATHFYLNLYPAQWTTHSLIMMRYVMLAKFKIFEYEFGTEEGKKRSEPEDQDYYGMGSRSARFTIMFVIGIVFCTLSPLMTVLCFINFAICRIFYGYLFCFAESVKADLGGVFWVSSIKHLQQSLFIYIVLMAGVLYYRGTNLETGEGPGGVPSFIAGCSIIYAVHAYNRFDRKFRWECLPFELIRDDLDHDKRVARRHTYEQPELEDVQ